MAVHSSILAWRIPWTEETGVLQSTGSHRVTRLSNLACTLNPNVNVGAASVCSPLPTPFPSLPASQSGNSILLARYAEGSPPVALECLLWSWDSEASIKKHKNRSSDLK